MPTTMYGVMGWPVGHSASPAMMNRAFPELGIDAYYAAFAVQPERIGQAIDGLKALSFGGVNVTIPHKQAVLPYVDSMTDEARMAGAVNTLRYNATEGTLDAHNTDVVGWWRSIQADVDATRKRVTILGGGGAARGILVALSLYAPHLQVTLVARKPEQRDAFLRAFGDRIGLATVDWRDRHEAVHDGDIIVNTTPIGMWPNEAESPLAEPTCLRADHIVEDIVYRPLQTQLLTDAARAGAKTMDGLWMLVYQGVAAVEFWTGKTPSAEGMREAALQFLGY